MERVLVGDVEGTLRMRSPIFWGSSLAWGGRGCCSPGEGAGVGNSEVADVGHDKWFSRGRRRRGYQSTAVICLCKSVIISKQPKKIDSIIITDW